jgi:predicted ATPase with chaperone activity
MSAKFGEKLIRAGLVNENQVTDALKEQSVHGGRLGQNLSRLGYVSEKDINLFMNMLPPPPSSAEATGLHRDFLFELALKQVFYLGTFTIPELSERMKLPHSIITGLVQDIKQNKFCEVKGGSSYQSVTHTFSITAEGRKRAAELLEKNSYVGPAPVTLQDYRVMSERNSIRNVCLSEEDIEKAFSQYVVKERLFGQFGAAVNSGQSIFIYGPAGNGKTVLAEALGRVMDEVVCIPHAVAVERELIRVYDPVNHELAEGGAHGSYDQRWVLCKRPVVIVGGELTLRMLDLDFNPITKFYEAPLQMKANGGVFIIDDFGRQMMRPRDLLNRWIVPLEKRRDFLTLHTGKKFEIPFDELVVFATNLEPKDLIDEAFLRRIHYKIRVEHPSADEFREIFRRMCKDKGIEYADEAVDYLLNERYAKTGIKLNACHPRDIVEQIIDISKYKKMKPALTLEILNEVWNNYFIER